MRAPMVIAIQHPNNARGSPLDLSAASAFGRVEILCPNGKYILAPHNFLLSTRKRLLELAFDPMVDYVLPLGDFSVVFFIGALLGGYYEQINVLRWIPETKTYQPLPCNLAEPDLIKE